MKINNILRRVIKVVLAGSALIGLFYAGMAMAVGHPSGMGLSEIATNIDHSVTSVAMILEDVSLMAGVIFVLVSFFNFHAHKQNPTQVPITKGLVALVIGAGLLAFPMLIPSTKTAVFGSATTMTKVGGAGIKGIITST